MIHTEKRCFRFSALFVSLAVTVVFGAGQTINVSPRGVPQAATVSLIKDDAVNYSSMVSQALEAALGPGGISNLVGPGKTVLIKPNLVTRKASAVTDWRMVKALVDQIKTVNGGAAITIAEGSASNSGTTNTKTIMAEQGFTETNFPGVALVDLNNINECPTNNFVLADGASDNTTKLVAERIFQADVYINCPKMKTHYHAGFTGALKNIGIGTPSWTLWNTPGSNNNKGGLHNDIRREILDHNLVRVPDLTLMDAIQPMEGQGPANGTSVRMNLILASKDPVALDVVACHIMSIPPYLITHIPLCANENVGVMDMNQITVNGNTSIAAVKRAFVRATPGSVTPPYELAAIPCRATTVIRTAPAAVSIDGNLIEWGSANYITIDANDQVRSGNGWNGPSDCSFKGKFMWDEYNLYFAFIVRDNVKLNNSSTGAAIVNGDGIELYISTYPKQYDATTARGTAYKTEYDHRIAISYSSTPQAWMISHNRAVSGFEASMVETSDGYIIEAKIPWNNINNFTAGRYQQIGLNVAVNDADITPAVVNKKLFWNAADQSDVETNTQKLGISYLDPAGGIYGTQTFSLSTIASHGSVVKSPDLPSYNDFATLTLTATPDDGYSFTGWSGDITGMRNPVTILLDKNMSVSANFANSPVLSSIAVSPSGATVNVSATRQFSAVAYDQSGNQLSPQPAFTWSVSGVGSISPSGLFTAGTSAGMSTITATSGNITGTAVVNVVNSSQAVYQINCGSSNGVSPFTADQYASGGTMRTITDQIDLSGVTNPAPQAVYQSERYGTQTYTIPNLSAFSEYKVRLHMAELYQTATGKRVFNVAINGTTVLSNFDIFAITGARFKAIVREFTTSANSSGQIIIALTTITDNATISGIEIIPSTPNTAPTIATAASASPNPVNSTTATLSVLGADDNGESNLTYTWTTMGTVPAPVTFGTNGTNAAKTTTATFTKAGLYSFTVTVKDAGNLTATSTVNVTVNQTISSIAITPANATIYTQTTQVFTATARDQFGVDLSSLPTFTWSVNGGGSIRPDGLFTAGSTTGTFQVTATCGAVSASASVTVVQMSPVAFQINCGSSSAVSPFTADQFASGGTMRTITNTIDLSGVTNPAPHAVYQSERYGNQTYTIPNLVPSAQYVVRLHMAELFQTAVGRRVFNVGINGVTVLSNFDIYAVAGAQYKAVVREFTVTANSSGQIVISFTTVTDNASICGIEILSAISNAPPFIVSSPEVIPNPVTGTTAVLSVLGSDDNGESNLTYTWATSGTAPGPVTYSANGTNAANVSYITFEKAGNYTFVVTIRDAGDLTVTGTANVTVNQTVFTINVIPANTTVNTSASKQFSATVLDQFGNTILNQPPIIWSVNGGGTISSDGLFTAGTTAGSYTITASSGGVSGTAAVTVVVPNTAPFIVSPPTVVPDPVNGIQASLAVLGGDDNGESNLTYTWVTTGSVPGPVTFSENGTNAANVCYVTFTKAGNYNFTVTIRDAENLSVTGSASVTVNQTLTSITLSPTIATVNRSSTRQFIATALDQFGSSLAIQPVFNWSVNGGGSISSDGLFTAGNTEGSFVVTAASGNKRATADVTVTAVLPVAYRINCGSNTAYQPFTADQFVSGGTMRTITDAIDLSGVSGPAPLGVYQSERYGNQTYTIPNLVPSSAYKVRLHMSELYQTAAGRRVFNIAINGTTVLANLDIFAITGARFKAIVREFNATANSLGQIIIALTTVTDNATISGIEIIETTPNAAPTISTLASATPNPVTQSTTALSVLGADDNGESNLTYTWVTSGTVPATVTFSANGTNAAKTTTATFTMAGNYTFVVTVKDAGDLTATSTVAVTVNQTLKSIVLTPASTSVTVSATRQFIASGRDQFSTEMSTQPAITWSVNGGGTITSGGLFTAGTNPGSYTVTATSGTISATAAVTVGVTNAPPTIATAASSTPNPVTAKTATLSVLGADDNGESNLTYTWATSGTVPATVTFSANGTNAARTTTATFTKAGNYTFVVTVKDAGNLTVTSTVAVTVNQTLNSVTVSPSSATVSSGATQQFTAAAVDQFGNTISAPSMTWSVSGGGTISSSGLFTAGAAAGGPFTVTAKNGTVSGTAQVTVQVVSSGVVIYGEALNSDYANYSWSTTCNFNDASPVKVGSKSLSLTYTSGWAGLLFQKNSGTQAHSGFTSYSFWAHGGTSGTRQVQFFTRNNAGAESNRVTVSIPSNTWTQINIPLSSLGNPADAKAVLMQECTGSAQPEFNIDQLELK